MGGDDLQISDSGLLISIAEKTRLWGFVVRPLMAFCIVAQPMLRTTHLILSAIDLVDV